VKSPNATDTKEKSAFEILQSLEIIITALDCIMLLRSKVRESNMTYCEGYCLEFIEDLQFGRDVIITTHFCHVWNKITPRHMLQDSILHSQCIIIHNLGHH